MAELTTIARPYAKAAFEFAVEHQTVEKWSDMLGFTAVVSENEAMAALLTGGMANMQLAELFIDVCGEHIDTHGQNLIKVMAENGRLAVLPAVAEIFEQLRHEWAKEIEAQVVSASELSDEQKQQISVSLEKRLARKIKLNCSIDTGLIAGIVIKAGDLVIDGSIRGKLNRLSETLQS